MEHINTYFYNDEQERFASLIGIVPIVVGMIIKTKDGNFIADHLELNLNNRDDSNELGLQVFCKIY